MLNRGLKIRPQNIYNMDEKEFQLSLVLELVPDSSNESGSTLQLNCSQIGSLHQWYISTINSGPVEWKSHKPSQLGRL